MERHQVQDQETAAAAAEGIHFPKAADGYEILCQIGASDHSIVYKAICNSADSTIVAIKVIDSNIDIDPASITNINTILSLINHPHILSPHCCFTADDGRLWIVMPYIHAGPLQAILSHRFKTGLPEQFLSILINQLLRALVCLHEKGLVHKAVKASNIFFDSQGSVMLSDLDVSKDIKKDSSLPYWVPPEEEYSFRSDIWSVGILAMEIAHGSHPIYEQKVITAQHLKISRRFPYDLNLENKSGKGVAPRKFGDPLKHFVSSCLVKDRFARTSATSLLAHPFVKKGENSNFLFKSIAKGMVEIADMFEQDKDRIMGLMKTEVELGESSQSGGKNLKITGWDYNNFLFELEPDEESLGKRVRFRGETVYSYKKEEQGKLDMKSLMQSGSDEKKKKVDQVIDSEALAALLSSLLDNIDQQKEMATMLMNHCGHLHDKNLEMTQEMKSLEAELAAEKEKSFQLELNFELLKLRLPDSDEEREQDEEEQEPEQEQPQGGGEEEQEQGRGGAGEEEQEQGRGGAGEEEPEQEREEQEPEGGEGGKEEEETNIETMLRMTGF